MVRWLVPSLFLTAILGAQTQVQGGPAAEPSGLAELQANASQGDLRAQFALAGNYHRGEGGCRRDPAEAAKWYLKAAAQADARSECILGSLYSQGLGVPQDFSRAAGWYRKAAVQGFAEAEYELGLCCFHGRGVQEDPVKASVWLQSAADHGHPEAQWFLGTCYARGIGVGKDLIQAAELFQRAANQGLPAGQYRLALCLRRGLGVAMDRNAAWQWCQLAAGQEYPPAEYDLAPIGEAPRRIKDRPGWLLAAAEHGSAKAQFLLGRSLMLRAPANLEDQAGFSRGKAWLRAAADQGMPEAQREFANVCPSNDDETLDWYRRAALQGDRASLERLGKLPPDIKTRTSFETAYIWSTLAANAGFTAAARYREQLAKVISPRDQARLGEKIKRLKQIIENAPKWE
jgi:TPR repeat protein